VGPVRRLREHLDHVLAGIELEQARPRAVRGGAEEGRVLLAGRVAQRDVLEVREAHLLDHLDEVAGVAHRGEVAVGAVRHLDRGDRAVERVGADREGVDADLGARGAARGAQHRAHVVGPEARPRGVGWPSVKKSTSFSLSGFARDCPPRRPSSSIVAWSTPAAMWVLPSGSRATT
jgi:hypothetical protein